MLFVYTPPVASVYEYKKKHGHRKPDNQYCLVCGVRII